VHRVATGAKQFNGETRSEKGARVSAARFTSNRHALLHTSHLPRYSHLLYVSAKAVGSRVLRRLVSSWVGALFQAWGGLLKYIADRGHGGPLAPIAAAGRQGLCRRRDRRGGGDSRAQPRRLPADSRRRRAATLQRWPALRTSSIRCWAVACAGDSLVMVGGWRAARGATRQVHPLVFCFCAFCLAKRRGEYEKSPPGGGPRRVGCEQSGCFKLCLYVMRRRWPSR